MDEQLFKEIKYQNKMKSTQQIWMYIQMHLISVLTYIISVKLNRGFPIYTYIHNNPWSGRHLRSAVIMSTPQIERNLEQMLERDEREMNAMIFL